MTDQYIKNYADALFSLCKENDVSISAVYDELQFVEKAFSDNEEFQQLLCVPTVTKIEKLSIINEVFKSSLSSLVFDFLCVLAENGKIHSFAEVCSEFKSLYFEESSIVEVEVTTTNPLSDDLKSKLKTKLEKMLGKSIIITEKIDTSLIGGIVINYNNTQIDGSLKHKLSEMKKNINSVIA